MSTPSTDPPQHVWVRYRDGKFYEDLPVVFSHVDPETGFDVWEAMLPRAEDPSGFGLDADMPQGAILEATGCPGCVEADLR